MKSPEQKYYNDPSYKSMVDTLESLIHQAQFTPSELREMAMLASIHYEMKQPRHIIFNKTDDLEEAIKTLEEFRCCCHKYK